MEEIKIGSRVKFQYGWRETRECFITTKFVCTDSEVRDWIGSELYAVCGDDKCVDFILKNRILEVIN